MSIILRRAPLPRSVPQILFVVTAKRKHQASAQSITTKYALVGDAFSPGTWEQLLREAEQIRHVGLSPWRDDFQVVRHST